MRRAALLLAGATMLLGSADPARLAREEAQRAAAARAAAERSRGEAALLRARSAGLVAEVEAAETRIAAAETALARLRSAEAQAMRRLAEKRAPLLKLTAAMQVLARRPAALALVRPGSTREYARVKAALDAAAPQIAARTAAYRAEADAAKGLSQRAEAAVRQLAAEREGLRRSLVRLAALERGAELGAEDLLAEAIGATNRSLALGEQARDLESSAARRREDARVAASLAQLPAPPVRPGAAGGSASFYRLPVAGTVVTGTGELSASGIHARGMTLRVVPDARVVAPRAGRVVFAQRFRSYGEVVILDHGGGWTSTITGLEALAVRAGVTVAAGQVIGRAGGGHVAVELRKDGRARAIAPLLDFG